jgi:DNA-directed RNA polymerase subunit alpha
LAVRVQDFQVPKITHEEVTENRGVFVIEPLDRGFGYTFGNSLRRVLLSSLEGAAVTSVKIEGVAHEFTTLPGVREDVTDIILNLKQLVCILHGESPEVEVRLTKRGEGVVTASQIEAPADLEILNPDLEIANLSSKGRLEVTLTIGRGRGYVPAEGNRGQAHTIGVIRDATELTAQVPAWLQADHDSLTAKVLRRPERREIAAPVQEQLIVELYSK